MQKNLGNSTSKLTTSDASKHAPCSDSVDPDYAKLLDDNDPIKPDRTSFLENYH